MFRPLRRELSDHAQQLARIWRSECVAPTLPDAMLVEAVRRSGISEPYPTEPFPEHSADIKYDGTGGEEVINEKDDPIVAAIVHGSACGGVSLDNAGLAVGGGWLVVDCGKAMAATSAQFGVLRLSGSASFPQLDTKSTIHTTARPSLSKLRNAARRVYWHTAAHLLGSALTTHLGGTTSEQGGASIYGGISRLWLCDGPPLIAAEGGFFYEFYRPGMQAGGALVDETAQPSLPLPASSLRALELCMRYEAKRATKAAKKGGTRTGADADTDTDATIRATVASATQARLLLEHNPMKLVMLDELSKREDAGPITLYKSGTFVDLCRGPHLASMGSCFGAIELYRSGASYSETAARYVHAAHTLLGAGLEGPSQPILERVYGIAFPTKHQLHRWKTRVKEALERDHRKVGQRQKLWMFGEDAPGSPFWLPAGQLLFNQLVDYMRGMVLEEGYYEVQTPQLYRPSLWKASGHWQYYQEDMFGVAAAHTVADAIGGRLRSENNGATEGSLLDETPVSGDDDEGDGMFGIKPMNCPAHCRVFEALSPTRRELPLRLAEFSALHRNESSGALSGMTRVRRFHQDDGHVFCRDPVEEKAEWTAQSIDANPNERESGVVFQSQIEIEVLACLRYVKVVYTKLGFSTDTLRFRLATRPTDGSVGTEAVWAEAQQALLMALRRVVPSMLNTSGESPSSGSSGYDHDVSSRLPIGQHPSDIHFEVDAGGGAFYGPKIDIALQDALGREHQCGTIQLDFNLPSRMGISYPSYVSGSRDGSNSEEMGAGSNGTAAEQLQPQDKGQVSQPPVLVHRAILGSIERMLAILAEHYNGKWPFWLAPRQVVVCGVADRHADHCARLARQLRRAGIRVYQDMASKTVGKRVRQALFDQAACIVAVIGDEEVTTTGGDDPTVSLRFRDVSVVRDLGIDGEFANANGSTVSIRSADTTKFELAGITWKQLEEWCGTAIER